LSIGESSISRSSLSVHQSGVAIIIRGDTTQLKLNFPQKQPYFTSEGSSPFSVRTFGTHCVAR